jgi:PKD repeat protein
VYRALGNSYKATVMKYDGSSWVTVGSSGFSAATANYTDIAIDGTGKVITVYSTYNAYAKYFGIPCTNPTASFTANTVTAGNATTFTDASTNIDPGATYSWDFDNDGTEDATTVGNVSYTYASAGTYTAKLTITNPGGCMNSTTISVTVNADLEGIYWSDLGKYNIKKASSNGSNVQLLRQNTPEPRQMAIDHTNGKVYWTDQTVGKILRSNLDGSGLEEVIYDGISAPWGIALDIPGGKMYWTDFTAQKVQRANLDGTGIEDLFSTPGTGVEGIELDLTNNKIYCSTGYTIRKSDLDGSNLETITFAINRERYTFDLDIPNGKIYLVNYSDGKIETSNLDGSNLTDIVTGLTLPSDIKLDLSNNEMYWLEQNTILKSYLNGYNQTSLIYSGVSNL